MFYAGFDKFVVQLVAGGAEGDVHEGTGGLLGGEGEELGIFQGFIEQVGFLDIEGFDPGGAALLL